MFAKAVITDEERAVDPQLGFPRGYAKLCRHAHIRAQGLISPFTEGPPQRFHPYAAQDKEIANLKGYDDLFPILEEGHRDANNSKKHTDSLWQQLDHMGDAGFDPAAFRVDIYGNVLYRDADPGSPLAWEVDYWFPQARGGKTVPSNLRLVQWQACQRKGKKLEFLVPWWDLQLGVSVNQFLSVFASKNASFRHRAFSFFFLSGENEQLNSNKVVQGHSWPRHFRDRKNQVGLAAAALVHVQKSSEGALQSLNNIYKVAKQEYVYLPVGFAGSEEFGRKDSQNLELEYLKNSKVKQSRMEDYTLDKENEGLVEDMDFKNSMIHLQREQQWKQLIEIERKQKLEESVLLEDELQMMKAQNVKEKAVLDQLEENLAKQKKRVEKQRRWSETQSQYRLCLEKMIRDTLHQCVVYKEQARLNQAACNALLARLESQKSACDAAEEELVRKVKQREDLEASVRPQITKRVRHQGHTDVGSCLKPSAVVNLEPLKDARTGCGPRDGIAPSQKANDDNHDMNRDEYKTHVDSRTWCKHNRTETKKASPDDIAVDKRELRMAGPKLVVRDKYARRVSAHDMKEACEMGANKQQYGGQYADEIDENFETVAAQGIPGAVRKAMEASEELEVDEQDLRVAGPKLLVRDKYSRRVSAHEMKEACEMDADRQQFSGQHAEKIDESSEIVAAQGILGAERKALEVTDELEVVLLGYEYQENEDANANREESVGDNGTTHNSIFTNYSNDDEEDDAANEDARVSNDAYDESTNGDHDFEKEHHINEACGQSRYVDDTQHSDMQQLNTAAIGEAEHAALKVCKGRESNEQVEELPRTGKTKDQEQLDELLQEVLAMQDRVNEAMVDAIREEQDEERVKRVGKLNLDKWLQKLLLDSGYGKGQESMQLISLPLTKENGVDSQNQAECLASEGQGGSTKKNKRWSLDNRKEIDGYKGAQHSDSEKRIGGLLKMLSFKNGDAAPFSHETGDPKLEVSAEKMGVSKEGKKIVERRTSPWRWVSPVSRHSASAGSETRGRRLSPWRRNPREDKAEERKMMEDFSKLRLGGERQQQGGVIESTVPPDREGINTSLKGRERSVSATLKSRMQAPPQGVRERSISTPPAKAQHRSRLALSPMPPSHDTVTSKTGMLAKQVQHGDDHGGVDRGNGEGAKHGLTSVGTTGGAVRKANMLKKSASASASARGGSRDMGARVPCNDVDAPAVARACGSVPLTEGNEGHERSLLEDLNAQDGLRASISLAWKKAVKKLELGRLPPSTIQSSHLEP